MVKININIQKKDLWLISAIAVFFVGVGVVIAYDWDYPGASEAGLPAIHGHTANELFNVSGGGGGMSFGNWVDLTPQIVSNNVSDTASSDGIVVARGDGLTITGETPIGTVRVWNPPAGGQSNGFSMPVKSGDSWRVSNIGGTESQKSVYWLPIVSGGGEIEIVTAVQNNVNAPSVTLTLSEGEWLVEANVAVTSGGSVTARNIIIDGVDAGDLKGAANQDGDTSGFGTAFKTVNVASTRGVVVATEGDTASLLRNSVFSAKAIKIG